MSFSTNAQTDTLYSHFPDACDTLFTAAVAPGSFTGHISGHNYWTDLAKVQKFDTNYGVPTTGEYEVRALLFWIAGKEGTTPTSSSFAGVWEDDDGKPTLNSFIDHEVILLDADTSQAGLKYIGGNAYYNAVCEFTQPIKVPNDRSFWAGLELTTQSYNNHSYVWLKTSNPGSFPDTTYVMDQWSDGIFRSINSWQLVKEFSYAVFPVIGPWTDPNDTFDLELTQVLSPTANDSFLVNSAVPIELVVSNRGNATLPQNANVNVRINQATPIEYPNIPLKSLAPNESDTIEINSISPNAVGDYSTCFELIYSGDPNDNNDTLCSTIRVVDQISHVPKIKKDNIQLYPVPANGFLNVSGLGDVDRVSLMDMSGKVVNSFELRGEESLRIDLLDLESGSYQMMLKGDEINKAYQFIKQ